MNRNRRFLKIVFFNRILFYYFLLLLSACGRPVLKAGGSCYKNEYNCICLYKKKYVAKLFSPYSGEIITHYGNYNMVKGHNIIVFNSLRIPNHKGLEVIELYDKTIGSDSIVFYVTNPDSSLKYSRIEFGGKSYSVGSDGKKINKNSYDSFILHGWQGDFAPVKLQNDSVNVVRIKYPFMHSKSMLAENSYFIKEMFTLKNDSLINVKHKYILTRQKCN